MTSPSGNNTSIADRLDILEKLEDGMTVSSIACEYGLSNRTIRRYRQHSKAIRNFAANPKYREMKRQRIPIYTDLESKLYRWFQQRKLLGDCLTDNILINKAKEIETEFPSTSNFKASRGWLQNWKKKYDIGKNTTDPNEIAANNFIREFLQILVKEDINEEDVYNMDETSLLWKALPWKTLVHEEKYLIIKGENRKTDIVTVAFCANTSGTHKLPLLFVNKFANPRALKHCKDKLPVVYKSHCNAWVNEDIFREWYTNHFKQSVKERQLQEQRKGKVILLVDNFKAHKLEKKELDDGHFMLIFLPPNTSSLIQPMDRGVITQCKKIFRLELLRRVLQYNDGLTQFYADYDIKDCIDYISEAWNNVTPQNIRSCWVKILNRQFEFNNIKTENPTVTDEQNAEQSIDVMSAEEITEWISGCEQAEIIPEETAILKQICKFESSPSLIEDEEIDRLLYNLRMLSKIEPEIEADAKRIIDHFNKKQER
ncbi:jerky protein homolog-like [Bombus impatiens]|uniref:Jerky protein homolog-like n=1 Tax=Bombus impatiens TaxID=132113 RepID=A0A6P8LWS1_BOMIM|nr:jerky protein homolog-like [Bombus impatiens]XP_033178959.1 jerky protein homolog-like [Bombus impatiens]